MFFSAVFMVLWCLQRLWSQQISCRNKDDDWHLFGTQRTKVVYKTLIPANSQNVALKAVKGSYHESHKAVYTQTHWRDSIASLKLIEVTFGGGRLPSLKLKTSLTLTFLSWHVRLHFLFYFDSPCFPLPGVRLAFYCHFIHCSLETFCGFWHQILLWSFLSHFFVLFAPHQEFFFFEWMVLSCITFYFLHLCPPSNPKMTPFCLERRVKRCYAGI